MQEPGELQCSLHNIRIRRRQVVVGVVAQMRAS